MTSDVEAHYGGLSGVHSSFVKDVVVPTVISAMRDVFSDHSLPVVVCTSLLKKTKATAWIWDLFATAIASEKLGSSVVLGTGSSSNREINAAADMAVLSTARDVVLFPGSTFSEYAAIHAWSGMRPRVWHWRASIEWVDCRARSDKTDPIGFRPGLPPWLIVEWIDE